MLVISQFFVSLPLPAHFREGLVQRCQDIQEVLFRSQGELHRDRRAGSCPQLPWAGGFQRRLRCGEKTPLLQGLGEAAFLESFLDACRALQGGFSLDGMRPFELLSGPRELLGAPTRQSQ